MLLVFNVKEGQTPKVYACFVIINSSLFKPLCVGDCLHYEPDVRGTQKTLIKSSSSISTGFTACPATPVTESAYVTVLYNNGYRRYTAQILLQNKTQCGTTDHSLTSSSVMVTYVHRNNTAYWGRGKGGEGGGCRVEMNSSSKRSGPQRPKRPSASARTAMLRSWGPRQCETT